VIPEDEHPCFQRAANGTLPAYIADEDMTTTDNLVHFSGSAYVELRQLLPSQIQALSPCVDQIMNFIAKLRKVDGSDVEIEVALREALANAIVHGNREDSCKHVSVTCRCTTDGEVTITVQDEGQGFESNTVLNPTTTENRHRMSGRGIYLMKTLMDEVHFEQRGAVVHMRKKFKAR
jgi:serine/threonine-protein kinase RsbW